MRKLSEEGIIKIFQTKFKNKNFVFEDIEFLKLGKTPIIFNIDTLVESTDIPPRSKKNQVARKSIVACVSDFSAKGVKPEYGFISITIPRSFSKNDVKQLARGIASASKEFGLKMLGGDTNEGKELSLNVCLIGSSKKYVKRKGAKENDIIFVTGVFGYTSAGLEILLKNKKAKKQFRRKATNAVYNPKARLEFGLSSKKLMTSSMDSSDGLSTSLIEMSKQSGKRFIITKIPTRQDLFEFAKKNQLDPLDLVFNGGEEYEIVFTASRKNREKILKIAKRLKTPIIEIGYVIPGKGVKLKTNGKITEIKDAGWHHFRS